MFIYNINIHRKMKKGKKKGIRKNCINIMRRLKLSVTSSCMRGNGSDEMLKVADVPRLNEAHILIKEKEVDAEPTEVNIEVVKNEDCKLNEEDVNMKVNELTKEEKEACKVVTQESIYEDYVSDFTERILKIRSCYLLDSNKKYESGGIKTSRSITSSSKVDIINITNNLSKTNNTYQQQSMKEPASPLLCIPNKLVNLSDNARTVILFNNITPTDTKIDEREVVESTHVQQEDKTSLLGLLCMLMRWQ